MKTFFLVTDHQYDACVTARSKPSCVLQVVEDLNVTAFLPILGAGRDTMPVLRPNPVPVTCCAEPRARPVTKLDRHTAEHETAEIFGARQRGPRPWATRPCCASECNGGIVSSCLPEMRRSNEAQLHFLQQVWTRDSSKYTDGSADCRTCPRADDLEAFKWRRVLGRDAGWPSAWPRFLPVEPPAPSSRAPAIAPHAVRKSMYCTGMRRFVDVGRGRRAGLRWTNRACY